MFPSTPRLAHQENCIQMNNKAAHCTWCTPAPAHHRVQMEMAWLGSWAAAGSLNAEWWRWLLQPVIRQIEQEEIINNVFSVCLAVLDMWLNVFFNSIDGIASQITPALTTPSCHFVVPAWCGGVVVERWGENCVWNWNVNVVPLTVLWHCGRRQQQSLEALFTVHVCVFMLSKAGIWYTSSCPLVHQPMLECFIC